MVDVVGNHMGIGDISAYVPFDSPADYHDCLGCPAGCDVQDYTNLPQMEHCRLAGLLDLNQTAPSVAARLRLLWRLCRRLR
jgi:alpha-amylase